MKLTMTWSQFRLLVRTIGLSYLFSTLVLISLIIVVPSTGWFRAFRLVGIGFSVLGALLSLVPRVLRTDEQITELSTPKYDFHPEQKQALLFDTKIARWGMVLILVGLSNSYSAT